MLQENHQIKKISFEDYDKYFRDLINSPDDNHIVFYRRTADDFTISISYDVFIIVTSISITKIIEKYAEDVERPDSIDVALDQSRQLLLCSHIIGYFLSMFYQFPLLNLLSMNQLMV